MNHSQSKQLEEMLGKILNDVRFVHQELKADSGLDEKLLYQFREDLDEIRLAAWTAQELLNLKLQKKDPEAFLSLLKTERLRRCEEMVANLSYDIDSGSQSTDQIQSLRNQLEVLKDKLTGTSE